MKCIAQHVLAAVLVGMASTTIAYGQEKLTEDDLIGEWILPQNGSVIRAQRCGDKFCGSDIKVKRPTLLDNSPGPRQPGILIPSNLQKTGPTAWHGELYNIRDGDSYEGTLNLVDKNHLTFVRCVIGSVLCETLTFDRIDPPKPTEPEKRDPRAVSAQQLKATTTPLPKVKAKAKAASGQPTWADFEAFLKERGIASLPAPTAQEKQVLFREFMAWWNKR